MKVSGNLTTRECLNMMMKSVSKTLKYTHFKTPHPGIIDVHGTKTIGPFQKSNGSFQVVIGIS